MSELSPNIRLIDAFPDDNIERVIWLYGAVFKNHGASNIPLVEVALRPIFPPDKLGNAVIIKIGFSQLDNARIGSIWKGKAYTGKNWDNFKSEFFDFDFSRTTIDSVDFHEEKPDSPPDTKHFHIPPYKYSLNSLPYKDENEEKYQERFFRSKLTKLKSKSNVTVYIPALELLTSTYTPREQKIRCDLLTCSIDNILNKHINLEKSKGKVDEIFSIFLNTDKHESNKIFLAHLFCNSVTRSRVSLIWNSMTTDVRSDKGRIEPYKHPTVLPYHSDSLKFNTDGIWLDFNKTSFLVLRITKCSLPKTPIIDTEIKDKKSHGKSSDNETIHVPPQHTVDTDIPITNEVDPGINAGVGYITSEVDFFQDKPIVNTIFLESDSKNNAKINILNPDTPTHLSSGAVNSSISSKDIAKLKQSELEKNHLGKEVIDKKDIIGLVNNALIKLANNDELPIESLIYIDENADLFHNFKLAIFPIKLFGKKGIGKWPSIADSPYQDDEDNKKQKITSRKLLLVKIILKNATSAYLLEIERRPNDNGFCGIVFNIEEQLTSENLYDLLETISRNKGQYRKYENRLSVEVKLPILIHHIYNHSWIQNSVEKKMDKVIRMAENKVFK